jgi:hypothetical protein
MSCAHASGPAAHLEALRQELSGRGWITSLLEPPGRPSSLFVQNPDPGAAALSDHILVAGDGQGTCWYWWPWATRIAPAGDPACAADRITSVLRTSELTPRPGTEATDVRPGSHG